jgi:hypothetical protein
MIMKRFAPGLESLHDHEITYLMQDARLTTSRNVSHPGHGGRCDYAPGRPGETIVP